MLTTVLIISGFSLLTLFPNAEEISDLETHKFHVSKCLMDFNEPEESLQISLHIFLDDLERTLENQAAPNLHLCTEKEDAKAEAYLYHYIQEKLIVEINQQAVDLQWVGKEISDDLAAVWCYMEVPNIVTINSLQVENKVLMDLFDDQKNIVRINGPNGKQGFFMFTKGDGAKRVNF